MRKTSIKSFNSSKPDWINVLDIDLLAKTENENWVYKGINCLDPDFKNCLISLSRGGKDAVVIREFNLKQQEFIENGFFLPESKSHVAWLDENTLLVADGCDPNQLTTSGYPMQIKILKRHENLQTAKIVFKGQPDSVLVAAGTQLVENKRHVLITHLISFYSAEIFYLDLSNFKLTPIPIPKTAKFEGFYRDQFLFSTRETFNEYPSGSLLSISLHELTAKLPQIHTVFTPNSTQFYERSTSSKNYLWVTTLNDVNKQVLKYRFKNGSWSFDEISLSGARGNEGIYATDEQSNHVYLNYADFLTPTTLYYLDETSIKKPQPVMRSPTQFKSETLKISQFKAKSKDGTLVPYFVVADKNIKLTGHNPTLLYGYGGFEISMTSYYLGALGKVWLEKGGVYVLANIRGGGEYGPNWHKSALRENRHKAYEDFYAIAEDLISRKISSPKHLGIRGGSNGGLLTSVAFTQRPELFNAVISEVPLANMLEYHHWLAGASWMEEYGNPDDKTMREYLMTYSPLHNLEKEKKYPEVFYLTSTKDDRVHPAHARQMVARMQELGHPVLYNENTDGGHGRASNMKDLAEFLALEFTYLYQKLVD